MFWQGFTAGVASTVALEIVIGFALGLVALWRVTAIDKEGVDPTNHIRAMRREDGGEGPIEREGA